MWHLSSLGITRVFTNIFFHSRRSRLHILLLADFSVVRMDPHCDTDHLHSFSVVEVVQLCRMGRSRMVRVWVVVVHRMGLLLVVCVVHNLRGRNSRQVVRVESVHGCSHEDCRGEEVVLGGRRSRLRQELRTGHGVEIVGGMSYLRGVRPESAGKIA